MTEVDHFGAIAKFMNHPREKIEPVTASPRDKRARSDFPGECSGDCVVAALRLTDGGFVAMTGKGRTAEKNHP
ncbi:hypothetical protein D6833_01385 [Candidatus Parcubacteria bacterium]|nr:MAG: hypothetical protein D6833_01385 [Candidatus Parcubacteria bacterium]